MASTRKIKQRVDTARTTAMYLFMANVAILIFFFIFRSRNGQGGRTTAEGSGLLIYLIRPQNSQEVTVANILIKDNLETTTYEAATFEGLLHSIKLYLDNYFANVGLVPIEIVNTKILNDEERGRLRAVMDFGITVEYH